MIDINPVQAVIISIPVLLVLLALGVPIFLALGIVGVVGTVVISGSELALGVIVSRPFYSIAKYNFMVIPLFILMGYGAYHAGISGNAFEMAKRWVSRLPGGLAIATTVACGFFGACCGSSLATAAAMGTIAIPEMRAAGYDRKLACGCVAAGGLIALMIPPSLNLVYYGVLTETSIGALLVGGIIPGILTIIVFSIGIGFLIWQNPKLAPHVAQGYPWKEKVRSLGWGWKVIVLFLIVMGGIYFGVATPSESAALGAGAVLVMVVTSKTEIGKLTAIRKSLTDTIRTTTTIFIIIVCASIYSWFLVTARVPTMVGEWVIGFDLPPLAIVLLCLSLYIPLGMFLDPVSCYLITLPIVHPIVVTQLGFDSVWFGIVVEKMIEIGLLTPPVGLTVYVIASVAPDVPLTDVFRGVGWFIVFELITLAILIAFPILSTWLPSMMF